MYRVKVIECELSDESKVYDVLLQNLNNDQGEDCIRFCMTDTQQADEFGGDLLALLRKHSFIF